MDKRNKSISFKLNATHKELLDKKAQAVNLNLTDYLLCLNKLVNLDDEKTILNIREFIKIELTLLTKDYPFAMSMRVNDKDKELIINNSERIGCSQANFLISIGLLSNIVIKVNKKMEIK